MSQSECSKCEFVYPARPVSLAQASTSGQFHAGLPPTVHDGSGMTPRCRQMSTVGRLTPSRSATSAMPTGSQSSMPNTVEKVLTPGKGCVDNHYMTTTTPAEMTRSTWEALVGLVVTLLVEDSLGNHSHYSGTLTTLRPNVGEVVLTNLTRTRLDGGAAGEVHRIDRRCLPLCKVRLVSTLGF